MAVFRLLMRAVVISVAVATCVALSPAKAAEKPSFNIPAGRLDRAIILLGEQAGISIALADPALGSAPTPAVRGRMDAKSALRKMLRRTGLGFFPVTQTAYRIIRMPAADRFTRPVPPPAQTRPESPQSGNLDAAYEPEIIVTGSKRDSALSTFPGSVSVIGINEGFGGASALRGTGAIVQRLPVISSTNLGPGRNKLFIRGVADSSFTGPTQATVGQYLGEARLNYNAPDPDLELYDIAQVEVLEGPQGTLYGAGSLGGIVRLIPNAPDASRVSGSARLGTSITSHGAGGSDLGGVINLPLARDRLALRFVGYRTIDGGYIDDARRQLRNINRSSIGGFRASLRYTPSADLTVDAGFTLQNINSRDSQYSEANLPDRTRASAIAQPFDNDYRLGQITIRKNWSSLSLVSASAVVSHTVDSRYDATPVGAQNAAAFDQNIAIRLYSNETRLARQQADGTGWVAGFSIIRDQERLTRALGDPQAPAVRPGVTNELTDAAAFGEWSFRVADRLTASAGARLSYNHLSGSAIDPALASGGEPSRRSTSFLPLATLSWKPVPGLIVYARYQEGFRPGGLSVSSTGSSQSILRFEGDTISTIELGARLGDFSKDRFSASAAVSYARWETIQADLVDGAGFPFSTNIGNGRIIGLSAAVKWRPSSRLELEGSAFLNDSGLSQPAPGFSRSRDNDLPNISRLGARLAGSWSVPLGRDADLSLAGSARYVGRSNLGVGTVLDIPQGKYIDTQVDVRFAYKGVGLVFNVTNLTNADQNRFSFGNPFSVGNRLQQTPLRPRTFRIGLDTAF